MSGTAGRRAPVQSDRQGITKGQPGHVAGTIAWWEHEEAYVDYSRRYGTDQSVDRLAARGGFGYLELVRHLGHAPSTWEPR